MVTVYGPSQKRTGYKKSTSRHIVCLKYKSSTQFRCHLRRTDGKGSEGISGKTRNLLTARLRGNQPLMTTEFGNAGLASGMSILKGEITNYLSKAGKPFLLLFLTVCRYAQFLQK